MLFGDRYLDLKSEQWKLAEELIQVLSIATTFLSSEENVSMSAVHPLLHGIIESGSDRSERFELKSLHAAHPTLLTAVMDSQFKNLT